MPSCMQTMLKDYSVSYGMSFKALGAGDELYRTQGDIRVAPWNGLFWSQHLHRPHLVACCMLDSWTRTGLLAGGSHALKARWDEGY